MTNNVVQAHSWIRTRGEGPLPRGYVPLGEKSTVVDSVYVPYLHTTYILAFESSWATIGGISKTAVLYAYDHHKSMQKILDSHIIFDGRNPMSGFYPVKIAATVCFATEVIRHKKSKPSCERIFYAETSVRMVSEPDFNGHAIEGSYEVISRGGTHGIGTHYWHDDTVILSQVWKTSSLDASILTKKNISRFYSRYVEAIEKVKYVLD